MIRTYQQTLIKLNKENNREKLEEIINTARNIYDKLPSCRNIEGNDYAVILQNKHNYVVGETMKLYHK